MKQETKEEMQTRDTERMTTETFTRAANSTVKIDKDARTVEFSFASEHPVERWYGVEKLEMSGRAADLNRLNDGGALLSDHNTRGQVGKVIKAWIGNDKRAHCIVLFSKRQAAEDEFQDVIDGIRTCVSFGYRVLEYKTEHGKGNAPDERTVTRWEALEISLVSVPADPTVGVGRQLEQADETPATDERTVEDAAVVAPPVEAEIAEKRGIENTMENPVVPGVEVTFAREDQIMEFGKKFGAEANTIKRFALDPAQTVETFRAHLMSQMSDTPDLTAVRAEPSAELGLNAKDVQRYSISRAILAQADGNWDKAGFERECHEAIVARGTDPQSGGFLVPTEVQRNAKTESRDLSVGGGLTTGGALVATNHMPESFIEVLRSKMKTIALGVQMMSGLVGNPSVPRQDGAATGYWVNEGVAPTESQLSLGQLGMSPKTCGAVTEFTRQLLIQSAPSIDNLVNRDLAAVLARTIDSAIIQGSGAAGQPRGILNTTGVSEVGMIGANFVFADAVAFETAVAEADAADAVAWLARPSVIGALKTRTKVAASTFPIYLIEGGQMNGYPVAGTTQMPASTLIYGDFTTIILGEWGVLEIEANRLGSGFRAGNIEVRGLHMVDVAVRYPQALKKLTAFA